MLAVRSKGNSKYLAIIIEGFCGGNITITTISGVGVNGEMLISPQISDYLEQLWRNYIMDHSFRDFIHHRVIRSKRFCG
jgi:hypothetical protein